MELKKGVLSTFTFEYLTDNHIITDTDMLKELSDYITSKFPDNIFIINEIKLENVTNTTIKNKNK